MGGNVSEMKRRGKSVKACCWVNESKNVVLENEHVRILFKREDKEERYAEYLIYVKDKDWFPLGLGKPFSQLIYRSSALIDYRSDIKPSSFKISEEGNAQVLEFSETLIDVDNVKWSFNFSFKLRPGEKYVLVNYSASADSPRDLLLFRGPNLYAGEGSFGSAMDVAIFGGLEYLLSNEISSSDRDMPLMFAPRYVPHPYKVTLPLMGVIYKNHLLGLTWNPLYKWDGENMCMSARFASPNRIEGKGQANHILGIFVPSVPKWVSENDDRTFWFTAAQPYPMKANSPVKMEAYMIAELPSDACKAIEWPYKIWGVPELPLLPRSYEEEMKLCIDGYLSVLWDEEKLSLRWSNPHDGWGEPALFAGLANSVLQLWVYSLITKDRSLKKRLRDMVRKSIDTLPKYGEDWLAPGKNGLWATARFKPLALLETHDAIDLSFHMGSIENLLKLARDTIKKYALHSQQMDGSWTFLHDDEVHGTLGPEGITNIGLCAPYVFTMLKYARVTGNEELLKAGLRGLDFMDRFEKPEGAQVWEIPVHAPDVYAAALAVEAYLEAYKITEEKKNLEKAREWAFKGLPFIYMWNAPDRRIMKYGSVPIFGSSFYSAPWPGSIVMWNGLAYAHALQHLAEYDDSFPWGKIAKGITICAMLLQETSDRYIKNRGLYNDAYCVVSGLLPYAWWLGPGLILRNVFTIVGRDQEASTKILKVNNARVHVTSGATITAANFNEKSKTLKVDLKYPADEISHTLVAGFKKPDEVSRNGKKLLEVTDLDVAGEGWKFIAEENFLIIKVNHDRDVALEIRYR